MVSRINRRETLRFGVFEADLASGQLFRRGASIHIQDKPFQILRMLLFRPGEIVTRDELKSKLWPNGTFVDFDEGLNTALKKLRQALGDSAETPVFIETVPRRGYRFVAPVTMEISREPAPVVIIGPASTEPMPTTYRQGAVVSAGSGIEGRSLPVPPLAKPWSGKRIGVLTAALVLSSLVLGFTIHKQLANTGSLNLQDIRMTRLTNSGAVTGVAISPDGRYVAYAKLEGEKQGLWLRQIAAQSDVQILSLGTGFHGLTFSPDGNYIYFVRSDDNNPYFKYLYSMPALGGPVKKLLTDVDSPVSFSPDGRRFVYEHCVEGRDDIELKMASTNGDDDHVLTVIHDATGLLFQPGPSWSPDGDTIAIPVALVGPRNEWALDVVAVSDGKLRQLLSRPNDIGRPTWLREDSLLVPLYEPVENRGQLWTISYPGGKARRFTNDLISYGSVLDDYGFPLDGSRDAKAFVALATTQTAKVWEAMATSSWEAKELTKDELPLSSVAAAPDGRLWAVGGDAQIWIMNSDGSQAAPLGDYHDIGSIAACGRFMIVLHGKAARLSLTRLDANGKHPTDLVAAGSLYSPFCSPEGKFVFYGTAEQPQKIWRVPVEGGASVEIAQNLGDQITSRLDISPDGALICYAYARFAHPRGWYVAVISVSGGAPQKTIPLQIERGSLSWAPDGTALQYLMTRHGVTNLWEQPVSGGIPKQITKFTSGLIFDFNWTFDHKRLLMSRGEITSDAVILNDLR